MESDGGFIQHVEDTAEIGSKLSRETDALRLTAAEGLGGSVQLQVVQPHTAEELEALADLGKDVTRDDLLASLELPVTR